MVLCTPLSAALSSDIKWAGMGGRGAFPGGARGLARSSQSHTLPHSHPSSLPFPTPTHAASLSTGRGKASLKWEEAGSAFSPSWSLGVCKPAGFVSVCCGDGGRYWRGAHDEGVQKLACPHPFFRRASQAHCPHLHTTPRSQHTPGSRGLSQPIPGILRTFQACTGRLGDFSLTMPTVL